MDTGRLISVLGLGFGDCGKGRFVDYLCHRRGIRTVVRFNGGAQAGHNVVLADGRHHTFSQFGSGTLVPGVETVLARTVVVHPTALGLEADHLARMGVPDALVRIRIDPRCRVTTPFHQALGRMRELARGGSAHGTCGVGVGETVRQDLERPETALRFGDLRDSRLTRDKLQQLRVRVLDEALGLTLPPAGEAERRLFLDPGVPARWQAHVSEVLNRLQPCEEDPLGETLRRPGGVLFEGAQGLLLDEWTGFHPFTTWSSVGPLALEALVREAGLMEPIQHYGVVRSYLTRHGPGPFPTEDPALAGVREEHNPDRGWQGRFRRGQPDGVLLDYARACAGQGLTGVFISHMDVFQAIGHLRWCDGYGLPSGCRQIPSSSEGPWDGGTIDQIRPDRDRNLARQERLATMLESVTPRYAAETIRSPEALLERVAQAVGSPVCLTSFGRVRDQVREHQPDE